MFTRLIAIGGLVGSLALVACGSSGGGSVSAASLQPRLLPATAVPGFGLQRTFDWNDPVNLVGEGFALPEALHPSAAVRELKANGLKGAAGETLVSGGGPEGTEVRVGVAKFASAADANRMADWLHHEDDQQPCFSQCIFSPYNASLPGVPNARYVVQGSRARPLPPGAPKGAKVAAAANFLAEFTIGPYLYWANLRAASIAKTRFEQGMKLYYEHAKQIA